MDLTVVGCAGSFPGPDSPASCYLVEHQGFRVLLDLGNGSLGALQRYADLELIDAVLLTHLHVDHCIDLASYYVARRYHPEGPRHVIPVLGPTGTAGRMARAYDLPENPGMTEEFEFIDHLPGPVDLGPMRITTTRVNHPVEAYAIRIDAGGRSIVYSGDTGPSDALVELAAGADLALFEASFLEGDNPPDLHLTAREAAEHARKAEVGHLVLTHLVAWNPRDATREQAGRAYDGAFDLARVGTTYQV
ncbi:MAG: MBL fold metallo-hydrolase [Candidatus Nanopelagicales bacterium]